MRQEIELYLAGRSVEFNEPPEILFSYIRTDYTDPTVLRNSYSKTLTIEGTPNNNQIFNSIYHLDQIVDANTFNPAKRISFQLFSNGDILEQGYAKLDKVNKNEKNISYDITLYGGLGEFLYNLSYDQTAEGSDTSRGGGEDRRLSSLVFYDTTEPNKEFDFDITKETVAEAWDALEKGSGATKWQYINFAPAYNGYPKDFDADKVLINTQNSSMPLTYNNNGATGSSVGFPTTIKQGDTTYRAYNNYALGELPKEMTEWEMRDLRSYLQRPVLSMKGFIQAISNPINNGGYNVDLDPTFFNANNPYYEKAWITLPMLKKEETETGQSAKTEVTNNVLSISSMLGEDYDCRYYLSGLTPGAVYNGIDLTFSFKTTVAGMPNEVLTTAVDYNAGGIFARDAAYYSSIFVQLVGEDENGNPIAASPIYNFTSPYGKQKGWKFIFGNEWEGGQTEYFTRRDFSNYTPVIQTSDVNCLGGFKRISGNNYTWYNKAGNQSAFTASLTDKLEYARVYFRVTKVYKWRNYKKNGNPDFNRFEEDLFGAYSGSEETARNVLVGYVDGGAGGYSITAKTGTTRSEVVGSQTKYTVTSDVVRSGSHISKGDLLNFDGTPCDYLLSYCKLFNLYISKDIYENTIHIRNRDSFYNGGTIDLDRFIDRSKEISVKPLAMDSRWYDFAYPEDEKCGAAEDYDNNYGVEYGKNKVQTTYEFDSSAINLFDDNIYQNGVQVQESSKYFTLRTVSGSPRSGGNKTVPTFLYDSIDYKLFSTPNDVLNDTAIMPPSGYTQTGYTSSNSKEDWLPKLQLNNDNDPLDGTNVLCFYSGSKSSPFVGSQQAIYYLTDDVAEMFIVNGETPCWLWTKEEYNGSQQIAKGMTKLPVFSRMIYDGTGTKIDYTWDFGRVRDTYVPVKAYTDKATIYERWWSKYIADLYDANTRVAEVYVKMEGKVVGDWLRAMYWWDNTYWVLTEINDYNITSYRTTKCKFVRVNDIENYTNAITPPGPGTPTATLVPAKYIIDASGETITAYVKTSDGGAWYLEYPSYVTPSQTAGTGDTIITLTFNANTDADGRDFDIKTYRIVGTTTHFWQSGTDSTDQGFDSNGEDISGTGTTDGFALIFNYTGGTYNLSFNYRNRGSDTITVSSTVTWITTGNIEYNGDMVKLPIIVESTNNSSNWNGRNGKVSITSSNGNFETYVDVIQLYLSQNINANGNNSSIPTGDRIIVPVEHSFEILDGFWATITNYGTYDYITAAANTSYNQRTQTVKYTVEKNGITTTATTEIRQNGGGGRFVLSPTSITTDYQERDKTISVKTDFQYWGVWTADTGNYAKPDWIQVNNYAESGTTYGTGTFISSITVLENTGSTTRTGTLYYRYYNNTYGYQYSGITITQTGKQYSISASPSSIYFEKTGGTQYSYIMSEGAGWTVVSKPGWVVLGQNSGPEGNSILGISAGDNGGSIRSGEIVLSNGSTTTTIVVTQPGSSTVRSLTITPSAATANWPAGTVTLSLVYTNRNGDDVNLTSSNSSWCNVSSVTWTGDSGTAIVSITANENNYQRQATISAAGILDTGITASATITQRFNAYINVSPKTKTFPITGGTSTLTINSNVSWTINIEDIE